MPETQYDRPLEAYNGLGYGKTLPVVEPEIDDEKEYARDKRAEDVHVEHADQQDDTPRLIQITSLTRPDVDNDNFMRRTWLTDLRPFQRKPNFLLGLTTFKHALQLVSRCETVLEAFEDFDACEWQLLFPNVLLFCALNFWFLTMTIVHSATVSAGLGRHPHL
jgi:hypothetical protein